MHDGFAAPDIHAQSRGSVFIDRQKGNPSFLKFVTPTIERVGGALARLAETDPDMAALLAILKRTLGDEIR